MRGAVVLIVDLPLVFGPLRAPFECIAAMQRIIGICRGSKSDLNGLRATHSIYC